VLFQGGRGHHCEARRVHWQPAGAAGEDTIPEIRAQFIRGTYVRILKALYYRARRRDATLRDERFMARLKSYVTLIKFLRKKWYFEKTFAPEGTFDREQYAGILGSLDAV